MSYKIDKDLINYRVCVLVLCGSQDVPSIFMNDLVNMIAYSWNFGLKVSHMHRMGINTREEILFMRNEIIKNILDFKCPFANEKYTHFLWLDSDVVFRDDLAIRLIQHDAHIVFEPLKIIDSCEDICGETELEKFGAFMINREFLENGERMIFAL